MSGTEHNRAGLIKVAKLYYLADLSQEEIAEIMGISRSKVSRMLTLARAMKIVEFKVTDSPMLTEEMEHKLKEHFGLGYVRIVPSAGTPEQTKRQLGRVASDYLNRILEDGQRIGVSWGTTVDAVIGQFAPAKALPEATVVQMIGGTRSPTFHLDSRDLTQVLADKLGAAYSLLHTPTVVSSREVRDILLREPEIAVHFRLLEQLDVALVGVGSIRPEESVLYKAGVISLEESERLVREGFATDVCGFRISGEGRAAPNLLSERVVAIFPDALRRVPQVVGVAVGEDKAASIIAAARGGFLKSLIIDEVAAILMMSMENLQ